MGAWQYVHPEATVNLIRNPSWEVSTTGWTATTGFTTYERVSTRAMFGTYCAHIDGTVSTQSQYLQSSGMTVVGGDPYTFSIYDQKTMLTTATGRWGISWWSSSGGYISSTYGNLAAGSSTTWTRYILTATAATSAATATVALTLTGVGSGSTFDFWLDGAQFE